MIYVKNDFYSNFQGAVKANDDKTVQEIMVDQFSNIIANRRSELIELLKKVGIKVSKNQTNEKLTSLIINNIAKNKKLQAGLAYLIAKHNDILVEDEKKSRVEGDDKVLEQEASKVCEKVYEVKGADAFNKCRADYIASKKNKNIDWNQTANTVTSIAGTIGLLVNSLKGDRANQFQQNVQDQSNIKAPNYSSSAYGNNTVVKKTNKKKSKKWIWIGLAGVTIVTLIVVGKKKGWFGDGGEISQITTG